MGNYVITGGASGIGASIKQALIQQGHSVLVVDLNNADIVADLSTPAGRTAAINAILEKTESGLDGFIACAGVGSNVPDGPLIGAVNYYGAVDLVEGLRPQLAANKAVVVVISSNSAPHPTNQDYVTALLESDEATAAKISGTMDAQNVYSGSKQALARWMRRNSTAFAADGIRMNAVAPGYTETAMTKAVAKDPNYGDAIKQFVASIPVGRPGQAEDIANLVCYLLSDAGSFICGSMIYVDGGHDAQFRPDAI